MAVYYRVEDEDSRARYNGREGILAEDTDTMVDFDYLSDFLRDLLEEHLDWSSREASPFISTYKSEETALKEARRRRWRGKTEVTVYKIDGHWRYGMKYRNVRFLAESLGMRIEDKAFHNSECEYVFAGRIPDNAIEVLQEF